MKFNIIVLAIMLIGAFGCKKEVLVYVENEAQPTSVEITVKSTDNQSLGTIDTRATPYDDYFPVSTITKEENRIYNMVLVVFNERQLLETYKIQSYYSEATGGFIGNPTNQYLFLFLESDEVPLSSGLHYFYVVANVPKPLLEKESLFNQRGLSMTEFERQILDIPTVKLITGKNSESRGFMMTNPDGPKREYLQPSTPGASGAANSLTINVGRAMAKVSLGYFPDSDGEPNGKLEDVTYKVVNNPNQMYVMPYLRNDFIITPHFDASAYNPEKFSTDSADDYIDAILESTPAEDMTFTYAMENSNLYELKGNSTMLNIKARFIPEEWVDADGNLLPGGNSSTTFYRIAEVDSEGKILALGDKYYAQEPKNLGAAQKAVEYPDGICYYNVWLKDSKGRYSVRRNAYFKVSITYVGSAGYPDEGGGIDPTDPIENYTTLRALVNMVSWDTTPQEIEL